MAEESARARLGERNRPAPLEEEPADHRLEEVVVLSIAVGAERRAHLGLDQCQCGLGQGVGGAAREQSDVDVALGRHAGNGDVAFLAEP